MPVRSSKRCYLRGGPKYDIEKDIQYLAANEDRGYNCFSGYLENGRAIVNDLDTLIGVGSRDFANHLWKDFYDAQEEQIGID